jgi:hypothetical protein
MVELASFAGIYGKAAGPRGYISNRGQGASASRRRTDRQRAAGSRDSTGQLAGEESAKLVQALHGSSGTWREDGICSKGRLIAQQMSLTAVPSPATGWSMPFYRRETPPLPDEPLWRWILYLLVGSTVVATLIAVAAHYAWNRPVLAEVAGWSAIVTAGLYLVFRRLGAREMEKRARAERTRQGDAPGE